MSHALLIGKTFDGYTLREIAATGDDEVLFLAERARDGEPVWLRTTRDPADEEARTRYEQRYQAERAAARKLGSVGALLPVREVIRLEGAPALVTDRPRGEALNDVFATVRSTPKLADVLPWFRRLMEAMEAAHDEGAAHGSLSGRAVYLDGDGRITICGLAVSSGPAGDAARRADVRALAHLMYTASCGRAPRRGFPDTGLPVSPEEYIEDYPASLARFLCRRLGDEQDDPVEDAGVFRRSIDALSVDPEFRKAAGLSTDRASSASDAVIERTSPRRWRRLAVTMGGGGAVVAVSVLLTILVMEVRVEEARKQGGSTSAPAPTTTVVDRPSHPRLAVWDCLHQRWVAADLGPVPPSSIDACLQLAPGLTVVDLQGEARMLAGELGKRPASDDDSRAAAEGYQRMFDQGPEAVAQHVRYRIERQLPTGGIEAWLLAHPAKKTRAVLQALTGQGGEVAAWSRRALATLGGEE